MGMGIRMGMGVSLQSFRCPLGLPRALHSTGFSLACRAASCLPGLTSPGRRGRGQRLSTSCASTRAATPAGGFPHAPLCPLESGQQMEAAPWLPPAPLPVVTELETRLCMRHPLRVRSMPGTGKAPSRARRTLRCRARSKDVTWPQRGVEDGEYTSRKPPAPNSPGHTSPMRAHSLPAITLPGGPEGTGKGLSRAAPSQGCKMHNGTQVPRETGGEGPSGAGCYARPGCPICLWGQQVQGLAHVAGQGPAPLAEGYQNSHSCCLSAPGKSLTPSPPHSIPAPCQPFSHNRHQCHVVLGSTCKLHGPRRSFTTVGSLGPMTMVRDAPCLGQGRTPA